MKTKGIRILDSENNIVSVALQDILAEISNGKFFHWSILYLEATGNLGEGKSIPNFEKQIYDAEKGLFITWDDLISLSTKFHQIIDITLIGCKNTQFLHRYENNHELYESCDIVIEMIDSSFWEVFSKDINLINRLTKKFHEIENLTAGSEK